MLALKHPRGIDQTVGSWGKVPIYHQLAAILRAHLTTAEEAAYAI